MSFTLKDALQVVGLVVVLLSGTWFLSGVVQTQPYQISNIEAQLRDQKVAIEAIKGQINQLSLTVGILADRVGDRNSHNGRRQTFPNRNGK